MVRNLSMLKTTSSAVISFPEWDMTPSLSVKVYVRPPFVTSQLSASSGPTTPSGVILTSELYRLG